MARETKVLTTRMGEAAPSTTLERHLDVQQLPKLLAEGWVMVSTTPPDADGNSRITLEREKPDGGPRKP
jgi:hypothetical protein